MQRRPSRSSRLIAAALIVLALAAALAPVGAGAKPKKSCSLFQPGADLSKCDLRGLDLSSLDLSGANLSKARLDGADLSDTLLVGADLTKVSAVGVSFFHANLREAIVIKGNFTASTFENADTIDIVGGDSADFDNVVCVDGSPPVNGACPQPVSVLDVRVVDTDGNALPNILVELHEQGDADGDGTANELVGAECTSTLTPASLYAGEADFSGVVDGAYLVTATDSGPQCSTAGEYEAHDVAFSYSFYADTADGAIDDDIKGNSVMVGTPDVIVELSTVATEGVIDVFVHGTDVDEPLDGILVTLESEDETIFQFDCTVDGEAQFFVPNGTYEIIATDSNTDAFILCGKAGVYEPTTTVFSYTIADDLAGDGDINDDSATTGLNADVSLALDPLHPLGVLDVAIVDEETGGPLSGMVVTLLDDFLDEIVDIECSVNGEAQFTVPDGDYSVLVSSGDDDLNCGAPAEYEDTVVNADYSVAADLAHDALDDDVPLWFAAPNGGDATPDAIVIPERVVTLDVLMTAEGGTPLANILVFLYDEDGVFLATDCTGADGYARFAVPGGVYNVDATDTEPTGDYGCGEGVRYEGIHADFAYSFDDDTGAPDVELPMSAFVQGMLNVLVVDEDLAPLSGIWVELYEADGVTLIDRDCSVGGESFFQVGDGNYVLTTVSDGSGGCIPPLQQYEPETDPITYSIAGDYAKDGYVYDDSFAGNGSPDHILNLQPLP